MSKNEKYASLLARGCFERGDEEEIKALLSIKPKLNINYLNKEFGEGDKPLIELAVLKLKADALIDVLEDACVTHDLNAWSDVGGISLVEHLLENKKWDGARSLLKDNPGKGESWERAFENENIKNICLQSKWDENREELLSIIPSKYMDLLYEYKKKNEWLVVSSNFKFNKLAPSELDKDDCLRWWEVINQDKFKNVKKEAWRQEIFGKHTAWEGWSGEDINRALKTHRAGNLFYYLPSTQTQRKVQRKGQGKDMGIRVPITKMQNLIVKRADYSNRRLFESFLLKEVMEASDIRKRIRLNDYLHLSGGRDSSSDLKRWGRFLYGSVDKIRKTSENNFTDGFISAISYHLLIKTTTLDKRAVDMFSKCEKLPKTYQALLNTPISTLNARVEMQNGMRGRKISDIISSETALVLGFHILKSMEGNPEKMKEFADSIQSFIKGNPRDKTLPHQVVVWSNKISSGDISEKSKGVLAGLFWQNIFNITGANQLQYLKKSLENPNLQVKLDFWNNEFAQKMEEQTESRKRTKGIITLLMKMNLINSIEIDAKDKPKRKERKM